MATVEQHVHAMLADAVWRVAQLAADLDITREQLAQMTADRDTLRASLDALSPAPDAPAQEPDR